MADHSDPPLPYFLSGDGDMAKRIAALDCSEIGLGQPEQWPDALKVTLGLCLQSSFPTAIYWGPDLRLFYNDAWAPIPAERHPWALGRPAREVWADIWDTVGPQMAEVMRAGQGFSTFDQLLMMERQGRPRESYWNYSLSPIMDGQGGVAGIFNQGNEVTHRVHQGRSKDFLLRFSDALRQATEPREIIRIAQRMLGEELGANRVGYGEVDASERYFTTTDNWTNGVPSRHGTHDLAGFGPDVHEDLKVGRPLLIEDVRADPRTNTPEAIAAFEAIDTAAAVTASLLKGGRMVAALYVHSRDPRSWSMGDVELVQEVAERTWAELARARAEADARASEERYRRIFEQTGDLLFTADLQQRITDCNPAAAAAVGLSREQAIGRGIFEFISPEDFERTSAMLRRKLEQGGTTRYDVRVRGASGETLFWEINSGLTYDGAGQPIGLHVIGRDATERRRWENHQRLLVGELNHRVKNTLAIVQSLTHQTFRPGQPPEQAIAAFEGRLKALASAHDLLTRGNWEAASIGDIVAEALQPFCVDERCRFGGPNIRISPQTSVSLALAIHELATNASKYGALSNGHGRVSVEWDAGHAGLRLRWEEKGGPAVARPTTRGFGTRMLTRALATDLRGKVTLDYAPEGVICEIRAPLPEPPADD